MTGAVFVTTSYLNAPGSVPVRPFAVALMSTEPATELTGVFAVMVLLPCTFTSVAARPPMVTAVPAANPVPRIVTSVPPVAGPALGLTDCMTRSTTIGGGLVGELHVLARTASAAVASRARAWRYVNWGTALEPKNYTANRTSATRSGCNGRQGMLECARTFTEIP